MARAKKPKEPTPVEATVHQDKRVNIPTADAQEFMPPDPQVLQVVYERDASLDPQLVWRDKYKGDVSELVAEAPPIYIQEKIDPRVLVENLRQTAKANRPEPELTLFDTFDGLDELDSVDYYRHYANWSNRMILGDSFQVMASLAEREALREQVQMIYIDPPYGIKFGSNWQPSTRSRDVKDGKIQDSAREAEQIKAFRDTWQLGIHSYLVYLRDRLIVTRDLLTESGSCFVQIGDENVHLVRNLLDEVFGPENFVAELHFRSMNPLESGQIESVYDHVLWFAKTKDAIKYRNLWQPKSLEGAEFVFVDGDDGKTLRAPPEGRKPEMVYKRSDLRSSGYTPSCTFPIEFDGKVWIPASGKSWRTNSKGIQRLIWANRLFSLGSTLYFKLKFADFGFKSLENVWTDTAAGFSEQKIYVVQTNGKIIERCMLMSTDPGDLVIDPTCGSGTTAYVAEQWGRRWIAIDTSRVALTLARQRIMGAKFPFYYLADSKEGRMQEMIVSGKFMPDTSTYNDIRQGFVNERVQHITLKSIAQNPDIQAGMSQAQIDEAIKRHADFELLYDRPYEDKSKVRVSGPFTVESLSPHRSLAFASPDSSSYLRENITGEQVDTKGDSGSFDQSILDNLAAAGIQNGRRKDRLEFSQIEPFFGRYIQAIGTPRGDDALGKVSIAIGPQYGTVDARFIKETAKEAVRIEGVGILAVLAFAFDPLAVNLAGKDDEIVSQDDAEFATALGERTLGKLRLLPVRMNVDLLMGEALKKTGAGNLFTVFGEPDIDIKRTDDGKVVVLMNGVDVYDPATGEVRSNDTDRIALWMIDTAYNGESFFVRHCYFTGDHDPYKRLKAALKADIDEDSWATMYSTMSRPFDPPPTGKIAVKVINDYGDEVMQVFEVS